MATLQVGISEGGLKQKVCNNSTTSLPSKVVHLQESDEWCVYDGWMCKQGRAYTGLIAVHSSLIHGVGTYWESGGWDMYTCLRETSTLKLHDRDQAPQMCSETTIKLEYGSSRFTTDTP